MDAIAFALLTPLSVLLLDAVGTQRGVEEWGGKTIIVRRV